MFYERFFIPKDTIIADCKTISEGKEIRVGKVESAKYIHDVNWYENKDKQYLTKVKFRKKKL